MRNISKMVLKILLLLLLGGVLTLAAGQLITRTSARKRIFDLADIPTRRVAIVFGAGLWRDGSATPVLYDRVRAASNLLLSGRVEKLLMSGDNRFVEYNEPEAMRQLALSFGVPDEAIVLDYAGRRTYDTCFRAVAIFQVEEAILVTQSFHLPRALYLCEQLGVDSVGLSADLRRYSSGSLLFWNLRELPATLAALWDVHVAHPQPVLGDPLPIFPEDP